MYSKIALRAACLVGRGRPSSGSVPSVATELSAGPIATSAEQRRLVQRAETLWRERKGWGNVPTPNLKCYLPRPECLLAGVPGRERRYPGRCAIDRAHSRRTLEDLVAQRLKGLCPTVP